MLAVWCWPAFANTDIRESADYRLLQNLMVDVIQPAHQALAQAVQTLDKDIQTLCTDKTADTLHQARQSWQSAMTAWAAVSTINFGPLDEENLAWRFQFWPDTINLVHRKFKARVNGDNPAIDSQSLAEASVAIQGLSAMEYLLYDPKPGNLDYYKSQSHMCPMLQGTSTNLRNNAEKLDSAWHKEFPTRWLSLTFLEEKPDYFHFQVEKVFSGMVMAIELIETKKLGVPLGIKDTGDTSGYTNPWQLESWRSGTSLNQILATLTLSRKLYQSSRGFHWYLTQSAQQPDALNQAIRTQFDTAINTAQSIKGSAFTLIQQNNTADLYKLQAQIARLRQLLKTDYVNAAGITFRFNAHDGD